MGALRSEEKTNSASAFASASCWTKAAGHLEGSEHHAGISQRLRSLLVLADRITRFAETINLGSSAQDVRDACSAARTYGDQTGDGQSQIAIELAKQYEHFMKCVAHTLIPNVGQPKDWNLSEAVFALGFADPETRKNWGDPELHWKAYDVRLSDDHPEASLRSIAQAYFVRNKSTHAVDKLMVRWSHDVNVSWMLAAYLAILDRKRDQIKVATRGLVLEARMPSRDTPSYVILSNVKNEVQGHRDRWAKRVASDEIETLVHGKSSGGGYYLVTAPQGYGKSAVVVDIACRIAANQFKHQKGMPPIRKDFPWLPGPLLHMVKANATPEEFVHSMIAQASLMLVESVTLPVAQPARTSESQALQLKPVSQYPRLADGSGSNLPRIPMSQNLLADTPFQRFHRLDTNSDGAITADEAPDWFKIEGIDANSDGRISFKESQDWLTTQQANQQRSIVDHVKNQVSHLLEALVREHGAAYLILDGLDELRSQDKILTFLPTKLPSGASVILTSRNESGLVDALRERLSPALFTLGDLEDSAQTEIIRQSKHASLSDEQCRRLISQTGNVPLILHAALGDDDPLKLDGGMSGVYGNWFRQWQEFECIDVLQLLSFFLIGEHVPLDRIQGYLATACEKDLPIYELQDVLTKHKSDFGLVWGQTDTASCKLTAPEFGRWVLDTKHSPRDLGPVVEKIFRWFVSDIESQDLLHRFVSTWLLGDEHFSDKLVDVVSRQFVKSWPALPLDRQLKLYQYIVNQMQESPSIDFEKSQLRAAMETLSNDGCVLSSKRLALVYLLFCPDRYKQADDLLRLCVKADDAPAARMLGIELITGEHLKASPEEGQALLEKAIGMGNAQAARRLGIELITGNHLKVNLEQGRDFLEKAIGMGDAYAARWLGISLIDGEHLKVNLKQGRDFLEKAIGMGNANAAGWLGIELITGNHLKVNLEQGRDFLEKAIGMGDAPAAGILGIELITGNHLKVNLEQGRDFLEKAIGMGDAPAAGILGVELITGKHLKVNLEQGRDFLEKAIGMGDAQAARILGVELIDGKHLKVNLEQGRDFLEKAIGMGDRLAARFLGVELITGEHLKVNLKQGRDFLEKAIGMGDANAAWWLGMELITGNHFKVNLEQGRDFLEKAIGMGNANAAGWLGIELITGNHLKVNLKQGRDFLEKAIGMGNANAAGWLGIELITGNHLKVNLEQGRDFLEKAIGMGDAPAARFLGVELITGNHLKVNLEQGRDFLEKAIGMGNAQAAGRLGIELITGNHLKVNLEQGRDFLEKAIGMGDAYAARWLGMSLIDGEHLKVNLKQGRDFLEKAIGMGNAQAAGWLGIELITGNHLKVNLEQGRDFLEKAIGMGDAPAARFLGVELITGNHLKVNLEQGRDFLEKAIGMGDAQAMVALLTERPSRFKSGPASIQEYLVQVKDKNRFAAALVEYGDSRACPAIDEWAPLDLNPAHLFLASLAFPLGRQFLLGVLETQLSDDPNDVSKFFLQRRGLVHGHLISLESLDGDTTADDFDVRQINLALAHAQGYMTKVDWKRADELIKTVQRGDGEWWSKHLVGFDDPEGHLVSGWLCRHNLLEDQNTLSRMRRHFDCARKGGWNVPAEYWQPLQSEGVPT